MVDFLEKSKGSGKILRISGEMTIQHADEIRSALLQTLESSDSVELDVKKVTMIDLAGLQLIYSAYLLSKEQNKYLGFGKKIPQVVLTAVDRSGFCFYVEEMMNLKCKGGSTGGDDEQ